jgi:hypothetical protein
VDDAIATEFNDSELQQLARVVPLLERLADTLWGWSGARRFGLVLAASHPGTDRPCSLTLPPSRAAKPGLIEKLLQIRRYVTPSILIFGAAPDEAT